MSWKKLLYNLGRIDFAVSGCKKVDVKYKLQNAQPI